MRTDLILHFCLGFIITMVFAKVLPSFYPVLIAIGFGASKELYDKYVKNTFFDYKDLVLTVAGGYFAYWLSTIPYRWWLIS